MVSSWENGRTKWRIFQLCLSRGYLVWFSGAGTVTGDAATWGDLDDFGCIEVSMFQDAGVASKNTQRNHCHSTWWPVASSTWSGAMHLARLWMSSSASTWWGGCKGWAGGKFTWVLVWVRHQTNWESSKTDLLFPLFFAEHLLSFWPNWCKLH